MLKTDPRLRERALGPFQGLTTQECEQKQQKAWTAFTQGRPKEELLAAGAVGVEDNEELQTRAVSALREIASEHVGRVVVVVAHGGTIHMAVSGLTGNSSMPHIGNGSITTVLVSPDGTGRLGGAAEARHITSNVQNADVAGLRSN